MRIFIGLLIVLLFGCSKEQTVSFGFEAPEAEIMTIKVLEKENIWFSKKSDGRYEFQEADIARVKEIYYQATNSIIPFGRSASYGPEMHKFMIKNLDKLEVIYEVKKYQGQDWIVWDESQSSKVKKAYQNSEMELNAFLDGKNNA